MGHSRKRHRQERRYEQERAIAAERDQRGFLSEQHEFQQDEDSGMQAESRAVERRDLADHETDSRASAHDEEFNAITRILQKMRSEEAGIRAAATRRHEQHRGRRAVLGANESETRSELTTHEQRDREALYRKIGLDFGAAREHDIARQAAEAKVVRAHGLEKVELQGDEVAARFSMYKERDAEREAIFRLFSKKPSKKSDVKDSPKASPDEIRQAHEKKRRLAEKARLASLPAPSTAGSPVPPLPLDNGVTAAPGFFVVPKPSADDTHVDPQPDQQQGWGAWAKGFLPSFNRK